jgi:predicted MFS family arabinose efflux permease
MAGVEIGADVRCGKPHLTAMVAAMHVAFRHPRFGRLLAALGVSQLGDWLYNVALLAYVDERTDSGVWLGVTTGARVLPIVVLGPLGGVIADHFDRRTVMIASDAARAVLMGLLALVAVLGLPVVLVPALAAMASAAASAHAPSVAASSPQLVGPEDLQVANAARSGIGQVCIVAGPGLGALLMLVGPPSLAFAANGLTFLAAGLLVASVPAGPAFRPLPGAGGASVSGVVADLRAGAEALARSAGAARLLAADVVCSAVYGAQTVLLLLLGQRLGLGADGYGYLLAAFGVGGVLGAGVAARGAGSGYPRAVLAMALLAVALSTALLGVVSALAPAVALAVAGGAAAVTVEILADTGLQRELPAEVVGRAYGLALPASLSGIVVGSLVAPLLVSIGGLTGALVVLGALVALTAAALTRPTVVAHVAPAATAR